MPLYEEKLINPLAVRFSQDRIWPDFQDGTHIEDSLNQIGSVPLASAAYDLVLRPPFPPMEVIRLKQERREADGERTRDEKGRRLFGEESWFTFDNRRLYCLQRAALQLWPMVVAVVVKVLYDFPEVRCARHKFRTTSDGCSVKISLPDGQPGSLWNWQEAARGGQAAQEGSASVWEAVRRDSARSRKEMLVDVPPIALLSPGTREVTVAERFNLGASRGTDKAEGKVAGQQLLSLLQGGGSCASGSEGPLGGLSALFAPKQQAPESEGWDDNSHGWVNGSGGWGDDATGWVDGSRGWADNGKGWGDGNGRGKGRGRRSAAAGDGKGGKGGKGNASRAADAEEDSNAKGRRRRKPKGNGGKGDILEQ
mmetsp:Transcript_43908/g.122111  ORF Transcript_43908/g.122111 Transcript_43908/m.122111 type:complete len:367 (-) Transcript_43908:183-1283(-)